MIRQRSHPPQLHQFHHQSELSPPLQKKSQMQPSHPIPHILICTPTGSGQVSAAFAKSLFMLQRTALNSGDFTLQLMISEPNSMLPHVRNEMAAAVLAIPAVSHLLFIDADQSFEPNAVLRLIAANVPVIGAAIPKKSYDFPDIIPGNADMSDILAQSMSYNLSPLWLGTADQHEKTIKIDTNGIAEVNGVGTGLMLISREVLAYIAQKRPDLEYKFNSPDSTVPLYNFFSVGVRDGIYYGEDIAFCELCRSLDIPVFADLRAKVNHIGQHTWQGDAEAWTKNGAGGCVVEYLQLRETDGRLDTTSQSIVTA